MAEHATKIEDEGTFVRADVDGAHEKALELHHLATADPERDGTMTGPAHEEKYGLERAEGSAAAWRAVGVHPTENRELRPGEDGYVDAVETADASSGDGENTAAPRASKTARK